MTVAAIWLGVPQATDRIATFWSRRAIHAGVPSEYDRHLYWVIRFLALLIIVLGWISLAYLTVWLISLVL